MKNRNLLLLSGVLALIAGSEIQAQTTLGGDHTITGDLNVGTSGTKGNLTVTGETGGSAAPGITVNGDGGVLFGGTFGTGQIPAEGDGIRMMWYPKKAAFRAGYDYDLGWNDGNIGDYSVAMGNTARASGVGAAAFNSAQATGEGATALGSSMAGGWRSVAMGSGWALADGSVAGGFFSITTGVNSIAIGSEAYASGTLSVALGSFTIASGDRSIAAGSSSLASGEGSVALGSSIALGDYSTSMGGGTSAGAYASVAMGRFNVGGGDDDSWVAEDPLFEIGNGTGNPSDAADVRNRNAVTVYKNGKVKMTGEIEMTKRQGDILMGDFGTPGSGD